MKHSPRQLRLTQRGFTLVEVLVALAIVAIALMAGVQATASLTRYAQRQSDMVLAQLCAETPWSRCVWPGKCRVWATARWPVSRPGAA